MPLADLKVIADLYAVNIVDTAHKVRNGNISCAEGIAAVEQAQKGIQERWDAYMATYMEADERALAEAARETKKSAGEGVAELAAIFARADRPALDLFVTESLYARIDPVSEAIGKLVDLQVAVAKDVYADAQETFSTAQFAFMAALLVGGLAAAFAFWVSTAKVTRPIAAMTSAMQRLAQGDHQVAIPSVGQKDEVGAMAGAVQVFKENAIETERLRAEQRAVEERAEAEKRKAMDKLASDFEASMGSVIDGVASAAIELQASAETLSAGAEEASRQSAAVSSASEQTTGNVQTVAATVEELTASIAEISQQIVRSNETARQAVQEAERSNTEIGTLSNAAQRIGDVVKLITDVAEQTNLLALNATIEAARAGEAGRGFAVVASEVKNLANQTAKATEEIASQIAGMQSATGNAVEAIQAINHTIGAISQGIAGISSAVEQQGAATREISRSVQQAASGTREVNGNIAGVNQAAGETGAAAQDGLSASGELSRQAETLRARMGEFLAHLRAA